jgi:hypothetical protein
MQRPLIACAGKRDRKPAETIRPEKQVGIVISSRPFENSALRASRKLFQKIALGRNWSLVLFIGIILAQSTPGKIHVRDSLRPAKPADR